MKPNILFITSDQQHWNTVGAFFNEIKTPNLDRLITDNTLVIFTTDHGHAYGHHGLAYKGIFMYDDFIRIPWIVRLPGQVPAGRGSGALQSAVDLVPTVLDYCGIRIPDGVAGISQKDVWNGKIDSVRNFVFCENNMERDSVYMKSFVTDKYKLTVYLNMEFGEFYDLESDPGEIKNLWDNPEYTNLKMTLLHKFIQAGMKSEPNFMPRLWGA